MAKPEWTKLWRLNRLGLKFQTEFVIESGFNQNCDPYLLSKCIKSHQNQLKQALKLLKSTICDWLYSKIDKIDWKIDEINQIFKVERADGKSYYEIECTIGLIKKEFKIDLNGQLI